MQTYTLQCPSAVLSQSGKGHQRNMHVGGKHCKRMASLYKHMGGTLGGSILKVWVKKIRAQIIELLALAKIK